MKGKLLASTCVVVSLFAAAKAEAQDQDPSAGGLSDIVVTANRREQKLQTVPVSISAMDSRMLADSHVTKLSDITSSTPSLQVLPVFAPNIVIFAIRGQIQQDTVVTLDPSVGVYSDEVYIARAAGALVNMVDLERVEVLNGPQGSLFGRNTTGGAVVMTSKRPTDQFEGWLSGRYEDGAQFVGTGVLNLPLAKDLAEMRLVGQYLHRGGFGRNTVTGNKLDHDESKFGRATLAVHPASNFDITIRGDYTKQDAGSIPSRLVAFAGGAASTVVTEVMAETGLLTAPNGRQQAFDLINAEIASGRAHPYDRGNDARLLTAQNVGVNPDGSVTFTGGNADPVLDATTWGVSATLEWDLGFANIRSITAYRNTKTRANTSADGSRYVLSDSLLNTKQHQFSHEIIAHGLSFGGLLNWSLGGQYFREKADQLGEFASAGFLNLLNTGSISTQQSAQAVNESYAFFGQGTFAVTPELKLTAGGRYTTDKRSVAGQTFAKFTSGSVCALPGNPNPCSLGNSATFHRFTYDLAASYDLSPGKMAYVRYATGYRSGGFNARLVIPASLLPFGPEKVTEVEVGLKAQWLDNRLRTNVAFFHDHRKDIQVTVNAGAQISLVDPRGVNRTLIVGSATAVNAGVAKVNGIDATIAFKPLDSLTLSGSWVHLTSKYDSQVAALPFKKTPLTPRDSFSIAAIQDAVLIPETLNASFRVDYSYRAPMLSGHFPGFSTKYDARRLLNANIQLVHVPTGVTLSVFGRNLTNNHYLSRTYGVQGLNFQAGATGDPRSIGFEIKVPFGAAGRE